MSAGNAFQARGRTSTIAFPCPRSKDVEGEAVGTAKCDRLDVADVSLTRLVMYSLVHTRERHRTYDKNTQFVLYTLIDRQPVQRTPDYFTWLRGRRSAT